MGTVVRIPFEVTAWEPEPLSLGEEGPGVVFGRVTLRKKFSGPLDGSSVVAMTSTAVGEAPAGYVAVELVTGTLEGRSGTFVLQHTGVVDGENGTGDDHRARRGRRGAHPGLRPAVNGPPGRERGRLVW